MMDGIWMSKESYTPRYRELVESMGTRLKAHRILKGYETSEEFAKALGIGVYAYRRYERGESMPALDRLENICIKLDVTADYLLFGYERSFATQKRQNT